MFQCAEPEKADMELASMARGQSWLGIVEHGWAEEATSGIDANLTDSAGPKICLTEVANWPRPCSVGPLLDSTGVGSAGLG